jgi:hypothetical protein
MILKLDVLNFLLVFRSHNKFFTFIKFIMLNYYMSSSKQSMTNLSTTSGFAFYSPVIVVTSMMLFSLFSGDINKGLYYLFWVFVITSLRGVLYYAFSKPNEEPLPIVCNTGSISPYTNLTYSTYFMCFTMSYLMTPLKLISGETKMDSMNYYILIFFIPMILYDLFVKKSLLCIPSLWSLVVWLDLLGGLMLGALIAFLTFNTSLRDLLYTNLSSAGTNTCSKPSNQQMRCRVYKNGQVIGQI